MSDMFGNEARSRIITAGGNTLPEQRKDEWFTPKPIIDSLGLFDLDPCTNSDRPWDTAKDHYSPPANGLIAEWWGRVWLNPPWSETAIWVKRLSEHGNGIALVASRTETKLWQNIIFPYATEILFMSGRMKFARLDGTNTKHAVPVGTALIAFGEGNAQSLQESFIPGRLYDPRR